MKKMIWVITTLVTLAILTVFDGFVKIADAKLPLVPNEQMIVMTDAEEIEQLPAPVRDGLELYKAGNINGAIDIWINNSIQFYKDNSELFESSEQARNNIEEAEKFREIMRKQLKSYAQAYGPCQDYILIEESHNPNNKLVRRSVLKIRHELNVLFWEFITIQTPKGVYIIHIHFGPDLQNLLKPDK